MAPTPDQIKLIRDFEPILFFHGGDANVPAERFFPSDAKRYLEHCALWKAKDPFLTRDDWGAPVVAAGQLGAIDGEAPVFLGKKTGAVYDFLETPPAEECFLDLGGWKQAGTPFPPTDGYADLDHLDELYQADSDLNASQFWYHAEFFDALRLRQLFDFAHGQGGPDFMQLFAAHLGAPAILTDPALICYYLFFPGHEEGLSGCGGIAEARNFGSFAGEWTCVAVLFDKPLVGGAFSPKLVGLTCRNVGTIKFLGGDVRNRMQIFLWSAMQTNATHPRFVVARGSHDFYLPGEVPGAVQPLTEPDPSARSCGLAALPAATVGKLAKPFFPPSVAYPYQKVVGGAALGSLLGPLGNSMGALAGLVWVLAEIAAGPDFSEYEIPPPSLSPTADFVSIAGKVVHPVGMRPPEVDAARAIEWRSTDNFAAAGRRYDSIVDREKQILWPGDPDPQFKGYTGRWGPLMVGDAQTRRAGMRFPNFSLMFFDSLVRGKQPFTIVFLTTGTTWTVPADWNNSKNTIECIGGGGGGVDGSVAASGAGGSGGGGAYSSLANLALTPGTDVLYQVGTGGSRAAVGAAAGSGGDTYFNGTSVAASSVGATGGGGANGSVGGAGGTASNGVGQVRSDGGKGANGGAGFRGGAGGGGAAGPMGAGGNGEAGTVNQNGGGGGGGSGGGSGGATGATGTTGNKGGNNAGGSGGGAGGVQHQPENPDAGQSAGGAGSGGGGGGGGGGSMTAGVACGDGGAGGTSMEFDLAHGPGGGGGGGGGSGSAAPSTGGAGGAGGLSGGGGGGGGYVKAGTAGRGGRGADGLIIITYVP